MRIITISRQFGSGGRELGKRLAEALGWDYYDKEIIQTLAEEQGLEPEYVSRVLNNHQWNTIRLTYRNSFNAKAVSPNVTTHLLVRQREIIEEIAAAGHDCVIVGRDADVILHEYKPFRIFVCADMESRVARCMRFENKKTENRLSERQVRRNIKQIDKTRIWTREILTGKDASDGSAFHLTVNAAEWEIKALVPAVAEFAMRWFEK